ncbi:hypothetical protein Vretimale_16461 [Volvox reticuliferus]|uniref:Uncharacterized protein n=1 Tax=Volvox reticuliferus TaxID=1737510 RepID=A0A8J4LXF1_9CHLO|nr:hypothetical protein Vretimale_16461 [Volvox reticuliferus]
MPPQPVEATPPPLPPRLPPQLPPPAFLPPAAAVLRRHALRLPEPRSRRHGRWRPRKPVVLRHTHPNKLPYAFETLFANQVKGTRFVFDVAGYAKVDDVTGELFMSALGLSPKHALRDVAVLTGFYGGFVLGALFLTWASGSGARRRRTWHRHRHQVQ